MSIFSALFGKNAPTSQEEAPATEPLKDYSISPSPEVLAARVCEYLKNPGIPDNCASLNVLNETYESSVLERLDKTLAEGGNNLIDQLNSSNEFIAAAQIGLKARLVGHLDAKQMMGILENHGIDTKPIVSKMQLTCTHLARSAFLEGNDLFLEDLKELGFGKVVNLFLSQYGEQNAIKRLAYQFNSRCTDIGWVYKYNFDKDALLSAPQVIDALTGYLTESVKTMSPQNFSRLISFIEEQVPNPSQIFNDHNFQKELAFRVNNPILSYGKGELILKELREKLSV